MFVCNGSLFPCLIYCDCGSLVWTGHPAHRAEKQEPTQVVSLAYVPFLPDDTTFLLFCCLPDPPIKQGKTHGRQGENRGTITKKKTKYKGCFNKGTLIFCLVISPGVL